MERYKTQAHDDRSSLVIALRSLKVAPMVRSRLYKRTLMLLLITSALLGVIWAPLLLKTSRHFPDSMAEWTLRFQPSLTTSSETHKATHFDEAIDTSRRLGEGIELSRRLNRDNDTSRRLGKGNDTSRRFGEVNDTSRRFGEDIETPRRLNGGNDISIRLGEVTDRSRRLEADISLSFVEEITNTLLNINSFSAKSWENPFLSSISKEEIQCALYDKLRINGVLVSKESIPSVRELCKMSSIRQSLSTPIGGVSPKKNVVFLKVHKAASTTMQNIFLRHAFWNQLNVILHKTNLHLNEHSTHLPREELMKLPPNNTFNILCHHIMFNKEELTNFFPNGTVYVGIVRDPFDRFVSAFKYYTSVWKVPSLHNCFSVDVNPLLVYINKPKSCDPPETRKRSQVFHRMIRDFGFPIEKINAGASAAQKFAIGFISSIKDNFDFIMVVEKFDESLILLRRLLEWSLEDMLYFKLNNDKAIANFQTQDRITNTTKADKLKMKGLFYQNHKVEVRFYETFYEILNDTLRQQNSEFWEEVSFFREVRLKVQDFCHRNEPYKTLTVPPNRWTLEIIISKVDCFLLYIDEIKFTKLIRDIQTMRFANFTLSG